MKTGSWRREGDSNPRYGFTPYNGLANRDNLTAQPTECRGNGGLLRHLSPATIASSATGNGLRRHETWHSAALANTLTIAAILAFLTFLSWLPHTECQVTALPWMGCDQ